MLCLAIARDYITNNAITIFAPRSFNCMQTAIEKTEKIESNLDHVNVQ